MTRFIAVLWVAAAVMLGVAVAGACPPEVPHHEHHYPHHHPPTTTTTTTVPPTTTTTQPPEVTTTTTTTVPTKIGTPVVIVHPAAPAPTPVPAQPRFTG